MSDSEKKKSIHLFNKAIPTDGKTLVSEDRTLTDSMKVHEIALLPAEIVKISIDGNHLYTILECLLKVHAALIREVNNEANSEIIKKKAYDFAYDTELAYAKIMDELKLHAPLRGDLN